LSQQRNKSLSNTSMKLASKRLSSLRALRAARIFSNIE
jgi:hypothetical protein